MGTSREPQAESTSGVDQKVSLKAKVAFASGAIPAHSAQMYLGQLLVPIYQITLGMNPILLGSLQTIMRLVDAFTDPLFAHFSDNSKSRWGRRKPYVFFGGIMTSCIFPFIWTPSAGWDEMMLFTYLMVTVLCFQTAHSCFYVGYEAMGMELATNPDEKTRLYSFRAYLPPVLALSAQWAYYFIQTDIFPDTMSGLRVLAFGMGILLMLTSILPVFWIKERKENQAVKQEKVPFIQSVRMTITCKPFLCILSMMVLAQFAGSLFNQMGIYAKIYVLYDGNTKSGAFISGVFAVVYFCVQYATIFLATRLTLKYGKKVVLYGGFALAFIAGPLQLVAYNPEYPYLILILPFFSAPSTAIWSFVIYSLIADVANYDEWKTGTRREGMFTAVALWLYKVTTSFTGFFSGVLLVAIGFNQSLGGDQSQLTKDLLIWGMVLGSCIPPAISVISMYFYKLDEKTVSRIASELEQRRKQ